MRHIAPSPGGQVGSYRLGAELRADPLGVTYRAQHAVLPRRAAVKVAHAPSVKASAVQMLREACILDALQHPGVPRIFESGVLPDRRAWFARELIEGPSLATVLRPGALSRAEAVALLRDTAAVLAHAHDRGVVHCGLRPAHVLMTPVGRDFPVCVIEWSCARAHDAGPASYPVTPESWHYTAPELAAGDAVDDRADVFALGVIAYQLLTGGAPFEQRAEVSAQAGPAHVPTAWLAPDVPAELATLVDQMLACARWDRPSSAEAREALTWLAAATAALASAPRIRRSRWTPPLELGGAVPLPDAALAAIAADDVWRGDDDAS